jgi:lipoate-protein ligase B
MVCTRDIQQNPNKANEQGVYSQGQTQSIGKIVVGKHSNLTIVGLSVITYRDWPILRVVTLSFRIWGPVDTDQLHVGLAPLVGKVRGVLVTYHLRANVMTYVIFSTKKRKKHVPITEILTSKN